MRDLSNQEIAILSDVGQSQLRGLNDEKKRDLDRLLTEGYLAPADGDHPGAEYKLTGKAERFLVDRGAGLNES